MSGLSRRINGERVLLLAWLRALLLQLAHPLIAAGVAEHSTFRGSAAQSFSRLGDTVGAMLAISFGTPDEHQRAIAAIRSIHRRVHGTLRQGRGRFPAGTPYSAEDSDLLIWVHATLIESIVLAYDRLVEPLTPAERDRYCLESAAVVIELGARADAVPTSWAAIDEYLRGMYASGRIAVAEDARSLAAALLCPFGNIIGRRMVAPVMSLIAAGQLPDAMRVDYGFSWSHRRATRFTRLMHLLRMLRRLAPARVALWKRARSADCFIVKRGYSTVAR